MNCQDVVRILNFTDPLVGDPDTRNRIEAHAAECPLCADAWRAHVRVSQLRVPDLPSDLFDRIANVSNTVTRAGAGRRRYGRTALIGSLTAVGAAAAALYFLTDESPLTGGTDDMTSPTAADEAAAADTEPLPSDAEPLATQEPPAEPIAPVENEPSDSLLLDRSAVVVLPVPNTVTDDAVAEAAQLLHDKFVRRLAEEGFTVYANETVTPYVVTDMEDVEIARVFGAATLLVLGTNEDAVGNNSPTITFSFIDAESGASMGWGGIVSQGVERIEERVLPTMEVDLMTRTIDAVKAHWSPVSQPIPDRERLIADYTAAVLDPALSDDERLMALVRLRGVQGTIRQDFVILAAIDIAASSDSSDLRARIWQQLEGTDNRYVIQPLLGALENESGEFARREAVTVLGEFGDDPSVRQALEAVERDDPSPRVREAASVALMSASEQDELIRQRILDRSSPGSERLRALVNPFGGGPFGFGPSVAIDDEISTALLEIAADRSTPGRGLALSFLRESGNPELAGPLLEFLTADPDPSVRTTAASVLASFVAEPGVREGLESALDDEDPDVRRAARAALDADPSR